MFLLIKNFSSLFVCLLGPGKPGSYLIIKLILIIYLGGGASALIALSNVSAIASALDPLSILYLINKILF